MNKNTNNNKKTAPVKVVRMPDDQVKEIMDGLTAHVDKHIEEKITKLDNKSSLVKKSDVKKTVKEVLDEAEKNLTPEDAKAVEEVEEVNEVEKEDDGRLEFDWKQVGKYFVAGLFGFGAGAAGKVAYDKVQMNRKAKKAEAAMSSANYEGIYEEV